MEFRLPDLGEGLVDAEVARWLVSVGERIVLNQLIVEVETAKATVEIPSPFAGVVDSLHASEGDLVEVGAVLITLRIENPGSAAKDETVGDPPASDSEEREATDFPSLPAETDGRVHAPPPVRKLAKDLGVDIETLVGSGPKGRVTRDDVLRAAGMADATGPELPESSGSTQTAPGEVDDGETERVSVRGVRRAIAENLARSHASIPRVSQWLTVDASNLNRKRHEIGAGGGTGPVSPLPIIVKALSEALIRFPYLNSSWDAEAMEIVLKRAHHIGIATDTERGLLVPVVRHVERKSLLELTEEMRRVVETARAGTAPPSDLVGSSITVTNAGSFGTEAGTPIINPPECAIVGIGLIGRRPWVVDEQVVPRDLFTLTVSFDHRILDGAGAGRFLRYLADLIEQPNLFLD